MLDKKKIISQPDEMKEKLARRNKRCDEAIDRILELDNRRRELLQLLESRKARQNEASKEIPRLKKAGQDAQPLLTEMKEISHQMPAWEEKLRTVEAELETLLLGLPNTPHSTVPDGADESNNVELRRFGEPPVFSFTPKPHWEIGEALGILDPQTAAKVTGARFHFYRGLGARLERACINLFLDTHSSRGYTEIVPPFLANTASMTGTGQLPKFAEDMFKVENTDFYLIPTAEVPLTNMYRDTIIEGDSLPYRFCAYSACFRAEGGSAGRDTRGLIRQHQFNKVELVRFCRPEESYQELEQLTADAESVLQALGLPYRTVVLCAGDLGNGSAKTYDIEVWMPSYGRYVEISSCSNFEDYQARRAHIRFRASLGEKPQYVHTLNGSGVAVGRTVAAILENYQQQDGTVCIPEALKKYMAE